PRPEPHDHDSDPQHHGASRLAQGRADLDVHLDRQDLAQRQGLIAHHPGRRATSGSPPVAATLRYAVPLAALLCVARADAGHELPFYPGYYPQEIRLETVPVTDAASNPAKTDLHAYLGADPLVGRNDPTDIRSVESLSGYVVLTFNPSSSAVPTAERRCDSAHRVVKAFASPPTGYVAHPYPVTPYHPDYLEHFDVAQSILRAYDTTAASASVPRLNVVPGGSLAAKLTGALAKRASQPDVVVEEVKVDDLLAPRRIAIDGWSGPPWLKEGWFHAYLLEARAITDRARREKADSL